jgi:hypothetical protein
MRQHSYYDDGRRDDGRPLRRCYGCGVAEHWPAASAECSFAMTKNGHVNTPAQGTRHWPGPYRREVPRPCKHCAQPFVRAVYQNRVRYCGPLCSVEAAQQRNAAAARARAARLR